MIDQLHMGEVETRFADLIWQREPIGSGELVELAKAELGWKKSTTYTVLKRLCSRGIFRNISGTVTSCLTREEFFAAQSINFVDRSFNGSLPAFLTAFTSRKKLSSQEIDALKLLIDEQKGD